MADVVAEIRKWEDVLRRCEISATKAKAEIDKLRRMLKK